MKLKLSEFAVPSKVAIILPGSISRTEGYPVIDLMDIDVEELSAMCDSFRARVFQIAEKNDPRDMDLSGYSIGVDMGQDGGERYA